MPEIRSCPLCGSSSFTAKPFGYLFKNQWLQATACRTCGGIFLHPQPSAAELVELYAQEYFEGDFRCGHSGSYFDSATQERIVDHALLERTASLVPRGSFLEIGCAGGAFLDAARRKGYEVRGVEFSAVAAAFARDHFGLDVVTGEVAAARFADAAFDIVFMGDVIEHLPAPQDTLREVARIMKPGGLLVILCPSQTNTVYSRLGFIAFGLLRRNATVHLPPYHLVEYRPGSMRTLLLRCGFDILALRQGILSPSTIALRGSATQNMMKKALQYPNYVVTGTLGIFGDRIEVFASKRR
jgi:SAM-dependent methyltransferase